jgi:hypothetical protein
MVGWNWRHRRLTSDLVKMASLALEVRHVPYVIVSRKRLSHAHPF